MSARTLLALLVLACGLAACGGGDCEEEFEEVPNPSGGAPLVLVRCKP